MKRRITLMMAIIFAFSFILTACSGDTTTQPADDNGTSTTQGETTEPASDEEVELVFYTAMTNEVDVTELTKPFIEDNNVKITGISTTSEDFVQVVMVAVNGGQQIDVMELNGQDARDFSRRGVIQTLTGKVEFWDRFIDSALNQYKFGDDYYGVPSDSYGGMLIYYNPELFERFGVDLPTNMQELEVARDMFDEQDISLFAHCGGTIYMWPSWYFMLFGQTSNGRPIERTIEILEGNGKFTDPDAVQAMEILETLGSGNYFQPGVNSADRDGGEQVFIQKQTAMTFAGSWQLANFRAGGMDESKLSAYTGLSFVDGQPFRSTGSVAGGCFTLYSRINPENEDMAIQFIDFMTQQETVVKKYWGDHVEIEQPARIFPHVEIELPDNVLVDPIFNIVESEVVPVTDTWLDWIWPPEVTRAFQEQIQMVVGVQTTAEEAMSHIQGVLDDLYADGYDFHNIGE